MTQALSSDHDNFLHHLSTKLPLGSRTKQCHKLRNWAMAKFSLQLPYCSSAINPACLVLNITSLPNHLLLKLKSASNSSIIWSFSMLLFLGDFSSITLSPLCQQAIISGSHWDVCQLGIENENIRINKSACNVVPKVDSR